MVGRKQMHALENKEGEPETSQRPTPKKARKRLYPSLGNEGPRRSLRIRQENPRSEQDHFEAPANEEPHQTHETHQTHEEPHQTHEEPHKTHEEPTNEEPTNEEPEEPEHTEIPEEIPVGDEETQTQPGSKRVRGPTKKKSIAIDPMNRVEVQWTATGEPYGEGSVSLSSFLGPLVRQIVPVTLKEWRKLSDDKKKVLWKSIQARYKVDQGFQEDYIFRQMGALFRTAKSLLVTKILRAQNHLERLKLRPANVTSIQEWREFVKEKTSAAFKAKRENFQKMRRKQIPHTTSRKGMVRLAQEMKKNSANPASISRVQVWIQSRTRKDGRPVNTQVGDTIGKLEEIEKDTPTSSSNTVKEDALSQVLGPDSRGRLRAMGKGMTLTKLSFLQARDHHVVQLEQQQGELQTKIEKLVDIVNTLLKAQGQAGTDVSDQSPTSMQSETSNKCNILNWNGQEDIVVVGRIVSSHPKALVNNIPLGPNAVKVFVESAIEPDTYLWRPAADMYCIAEAVNAEIAWPETKIEVTKIGSEGSALSSPLSVSAKNDSKCKLLDWSQSGEIYVGEGRWCSKDPKTLVNDVPLGPNAMKVSVDIATEPEAFLWRPTKDMFQMEHAVGKIVAWPTSKVLINSCSKSPDNVSSTSNVSARSNGKWKLLDCTGSGEVVAEGRLSSKDPNILVHHIRLGPNAFRMWVDTVRNPEACLWRPTSDMACMEDAIGTTVAWPADKVIQPE